MPKNSKNIFIWVAVIFVIVVVASFFIPKKSQAPTSGKFDAFAQCLSDKGAKFYGAFWCSHCNNQKKAFGDSKKYLPYIECSTPDGKGQTQVCKDAKIEGYPTWVFADGSKQEGEVPMQTLADKTSCQLPQ